MFVQKICEECIKLWMCVVTVRKMGKKGINRDVDQKDLFICVWKKKAKLIGHV